uniref:Uncharacterized protein n=1 Tax=Oryza punctata TaxID=4537 RepID=A0A0E0ME51_ORYPU
MAPTRVAMLDRVRLPTRICFHLGSLQFIVDESGRLAQVSPDVIRCVGATRFALGTEFHFGSIDFITTNINIIELTVLSTMPTSSPLLSQAQELVWDHSAPFGVKNATVVVTEHLVVIGEHIAACRKTTQACLTPCHQTRVPRELGPCWVGFLNETGYSIQ